MPTRFPPSSTLSPEFLLVAACCRWPHSADSAAAISAAAVAGVDWRRFLRILKRQRVEALAKRALELTDIGMPEDVRADIVAASLEIARQNLTHVAESARLARAFDTANMQLLFLKGVSLGMLAYGDVSIKRERDIDILIPAAEVEDAFRIMTSAGYRRVSPGQDYPDRKIRAFINNCKETAWHHDGRATLVELHSGLADNPLLLKGVDAYSPHQLVPTGIGALPTLRDAELFAYLCVHGATHAWSRLKWLADLAAFVRRFEPADIERLYEEAEKLGCGRCAAQGLLLAQDLLGLWLPSRLEERLRGDRASALLIRAAFGAMAGKNEAEELDRRIFATVSLHLSHFRLKKGIRYKLGEVRRKLFAPNPALTILPPWLALIYPILLVPNWLLRRAKIASR